MGEHDQNETQRQMARQLATAHNEITNLRDLLQGAQSQLIQQRNVINRLTGDPLTFGTPVSSTIEFAPTAFWNPKHTLPTPAVVSANWSRHRP